MAQVHDENSKIADFSDDFNSSGFISRLFHSWTSKYISKCLDLMLNSTGIFKLLIDYVRNKFKKNNNCAK